jgi:ribosomal protein S20
MNDFGNIATEIVTYDFPNDTGSYPLSYVSGWLEANIGELSIAVNEEFTVNDAGEIYVGDCSGLMPQEKEIFKSIYSIHYYEKSARETLRNSAYGTTADWTVLKEGDTTIQRQNKNSIAKTFNELASQAKSDLNDMIFKHNRYKSGPRQVYGADAMNSTDALGDDGIDSLRS